MNRKTAGAFAVIGTVALGIGTCWKIDDVYTADKRNRTRVTYGLSQMQEVAKRVEEFYAVRQSLPKSTDELGVYQRFEQKSAAQDLEMPERIAFDLSVVSGKIVATFAFDQEDLSAKTLVLSPTVSATGVFEWACAGTMSEKLMPRKCSPQTR
jgi:hypothetical protein